MQPVKMYTGPHCPYCTMAKKFLASMGVDHIEEINIQENPAYFAEMQQLSGRRSVPQIFIGSTHVGGYTDIYSMHQRGELADLLAGK